MSKSYVTSLVALCMGMSVVAASHATTISTLSARYGSPESGKVCDATPAVASLCNGQTACEVRVVNSAMCGDPDFLSVKKVVVQYGCGKAVRQAVAGEYSSVHLGCD